MSKFVWGSARGKIIMHIFVLLLAAAGLLNVQCEEYRGKSLGKFNSYHHQVSGEVYAVDEYTLLIIGFTYDGTGIDSFFWAGASTRPGPQGFIVPNEYGKTNILKTYQNKDIKITLPDRKKITEIKWFAVYDLTRQDAFGDVYIPEEFEPPVSQIISQLVGRSHGVASDPIEIINAKTLKIPQFTYNGASSSAYFWVGIGPQPTAKGHIVPDENGYVDTLRLYSEETITLELPGDLTIFDIDWLSVYDINNQQNFGSVIIPDDPNVPPSLSKVLKYKSALPNCLQLHKKLQVSWEIFGPAITIQLAGQIDEDEYIAFGQSTSNGNFHMVGSDVTIAYIDGYRKIADDYNITAKTVCTKVLGQFKGVCKDELVGGMDSNQIHNGDRVDGINIITYRRSFISADVGDVEYKTNGTSKLIWAIGKLFHNKEPAIHSFYPRSSVNVELNRKESSSNCFAFIKTFTTDKNISSLVFQPICHWQIIFNCLLFSQESWESYKLFDRTVRSFTATLGPAGGKSGYEGITGMPSGGLVWYIDGKITPEIWMRRGLTYAINVFGGNDPRSAEYYNPMIITDEPHGGYEHLTEQMQKHVKVLAGVQFTLRGQPRPTTGDAAVLEITPNSSWPDIVYYNSYTRFNMGWKIHIVDNFNLLAINSAKHMESHIYLFYIVIMIFNLWIYH